MNNLLTRVAIIGCGGRAREHIPLMLRHPENNRVVVVSESSAAAYQKLKLLFSDAGLPVPPNQPDLARLLDEYKDKLDAAFIITPHRYHYEQAKLCLDAGLDVLLEKPMVIHAQEAVDLIAARDRTNRLLVVAFNGSLSPYIRHAVAVLRSGELGEILNISATIWQNWEVDTHGSGCKTR